MERLARPAAQALERAASQRERGTNGKPPHEYLLGGAPLSRFSRSSRRVKPRQELRSGPAELVDVGRGKRGQAAGAGRREGQPDCAMVRGVDVPFDQARLSCPVDESDDAVVPEKEMLGDLADRRGAAGMPADGQQQLVLGGRDPRVERLLLAPVHEASEPVAKHEEVFVVLV